MREITYVKAFTESLMQLMAEDENVLIIGEDVAHYGGVFHAFDGLWKTYGEKRVIDTPISEMGFIGMGVGAAARGLRPVCDLMFFDFIGVALDQLYNQAAKLKFIVPATVFFVVYYFILPVTVGYFPKFMEKPVWGDANLAYLFAFSQFIMAWVLAAIYVKQAGAWDRMAAAVLARLGKN